MDMSAASELLARQASRQAASRAERIADMPVMLAVLSVQQAAGFTATCMREEARPNLAGDEPARMAVIFAAPAAQPRPQQGLAGAFNGAVAARLSMGMNGEGDVYSGV